MAKSRSIKNALVTLLSGIQYNGEPAFVDVKGYPANQFDGIPFIFIEPADQLSEKVATRESDRTVSFTVSTYVPSTQDGTDFDYLYDLTDLIIDTLDTGDWDSTLNTIDATIGTYMMDAKRGAWNLVDTPLGPALSADITVEVKYSKES